MQQYILQTYDKALAIVNGNPLRLSESIQAMIVEYTGVSVEDLDIKVHNEGLNYRVFHKDSDTLQYFYLIPLPVITNQKPNNMKTYIVLIPVDEPSVNPRATCEFIEGNLYNTYGELLEALETHKVHRYANILELREFTTTINDEAINLSEYFITYVNTID